MKIELNRHFGVQFHLTNSGWCFELEADATTPAYRSVYYGSLSNVLAAFSSYIQNHGGI